MRHTARHLTSQLATRGGQLTSRGARFLTSPTMRRSHSSHVHGAGCVDQGCGAPASLGGDNHTTAALPHRMGGNRGPLVLCIMDGWGHREEREDNAIKLGRLPNYNRFLETETLGFLQASAEEVGLPDGQIGNSEVGHMNLGAGRIIYQDLLAIDKGIADGTIFDSPSLEKHIRELKATGGSCHLMGLLSPGGVHAHEIHMGAFARYIASQGVPVVIHAFADGRDVPPNDFGRSSALFLETLSDVRGVTVGTVSGRYFAMDRDKRWDRVGRAYDVIIKAQGERASDVASAVSGAYEKGESDEFIAPTAIGEYDGFKDGDGIFFANFRADRARQILDAFVDPAFDGFERPQLHIADALGMVGYSDTLDNHMSSIVAGKDIPLIMPEVISQAGLTQLRIAETEKYAHVTFFLSGGREKPFDGEDRLLVSSPKVATYDLAPEMSAVEVTDNLVRDINEGNHDVIFVNFANADMVGHTGFFDAAVRAVETIDDCLGRLESAVKAKNGCLLLTADHGNAEMMRDPESGERHTAHTLNPVPLLMVNGPSGARLNNGRLCDVAPTMLQLLGLEQPVPMTGRSLLF